MTPSPELRVTELDFTGIRQNLLQFLQSQEEFSDFNFDGSALSVLIDLLARNTHYNAVLTHLQANEMFLDTAIKRSSVVSIAKTLGYTPRSVTSARAKVNVTVTANNDQTTLVLGSSTQFSSTVNGRTFTFFPDRDYVASKVDGVFVFRNVVLVEGTPITNTFRVALDSVSGPFTISAGNIDLSTLKVSVIAGDTENQLSPVDRSTSVIDIDDTSTVYWVEEGPDERYLLKFGDGIIGAPLTVNNIVLATYLASNGPAANGCRLFTVGTVSGQSVISIELIARAAAGSDRESIDSIRFYAPRVNTSRNRVVTAQDYRNLILSSFDKAKSVVVWGGEENNPPIFGKIFITIDPKDGYVITEGDEQFLTETVLRPRAMLSIQHEFVDPEYLYIGLDVRVQYNPKKTSLTASQIETVVAEEVSRYFLEEVSTLDQTFFYSRLIDQIQGVNQSLTSVLVKMDLRKKLAFPLNAPITERVEFLGAIYPGSVMSTQYETVINGVRKVVHLHDYPDNIPAKAQTGKLWVVLDDHTTKTEHVGNIDYATGRVDLFGVFISDYLGADPSLVLTAVPTELSKNISPKIVRSSPTIDTAIVPFPAKNIIISLDTTQAEAATGKTTGLTVSATPFLDRV